MTFNPYDPSTHHLQRRDSTQHRGEVHKRCAWADDVRVTLSRLREEIQRLNDEVTIAKMTCNHTLKNGVSAFETKYHNDCDEYQACSVCQRG